MAIEVTGGFILAGWEGGWRLGGRFVWVDGGWVGILVAFVEAVEVGLVRVWGGRDGVRLNDALAASSIMW